MKTLELLKVADKILADARYNKDGRSKEDERLGKKKQSKPYTIRAILHGRGLGYHYDIR